jgi:putative NADH-flavin reductase
MRIAVFGATGGTGQALVRQALDRGDEVCALVRTPGSLPIEHARLRVVAGDATRDAAAVAEVIQGRDIVVSALGRRNSLKSDQLMVRSVRTIVPAMQRTGLRRLIVVSAFGVGETRRGAPLVPRIMYRVLLGDIFADKKAAEDEVRASGLDWTIVHPVLLTNGPRTGRYRVGEHLELAGVPKIARADVADFILDEAGSNRYVRKAAAISY